MRDFHRGGAYLVAGRRQLGWLGDQITSLARFLSSSTALATTSGWSAALVHREYVNQAKQAFFPLQHCNGVSPKIGLTAVCRQAHRQLRRSARADASRGSLPGRVSQFPGTSNHCYRRGARRGAPREDRLKSNLQSDITQLGVDVMRASHVVPERHKGDERHRQATVGKSARLLSFRTRLAGPSTRW